MKIRYLPVLCVCAVPQFGCGNQAEAIDSTTDDPVEQKRAATQCGSYWDGQQVELYNGRLGVSKAFVDKHQRRVGLASRNCTGTLISDDLFISAGHCNFAVDDYVVFDYQYDASQNFREPRRYRVGAIVEQEFNSDWDYAIVRLDGKPGIEYGHALIAPIDPAVGSRVTIIQHPAGYEPTGVPKEVAVGKVVDNAPPNGPNGLLHNVDTRGGSSGAGVLDDAGRIVAIHVTGGCATDNSGANGAIRMSRLVAHSTTLQGLANSRILWQETSGMISLWTMNPDGTLRTYRNHGPYDGWLPVNTENNRVLWKHTSGQISLWTVNADGDYVSSVVHGPIDGWSVVNYANNRLLWQHTTGRISYWVLDDSGQVQGSPIEHGPFAGWTVVNQSNNRILWRHDSGAISLWVVDDSGNHLADVGYGPYADWTARSYSNNELFLTSTSGATALWTVDRAGVGLTYAGYGPYDGWTPIANADGWLLWRDTSGQYAYWKTGSLGEGLGYALIGPYSGWTVVSITGGRP